MKKKKDTTNIFIRGVPVRLKGRFRHWCFIRNISMKSQIVYMMERTLHETECAERKSE